MKIGTWVKNKDNELGVIASITDRHEPIVIHKNKTIVYTNKKHLKEVFKK
ncbi:MAG: hypothetical protein ACRCR2_03665 [Fusobacteriaceae bacterium]